MQQCGQPEELQTVTFKAIQYPARRENTDESSSLWYISHPPHPLVGAAGHVEKKQTISLQADQQIINSSSLFFPWRQVEST